MIQVGCYKPVMNEMTDLTYALDVGGRFGAFVGNFFAFRSCVCCLLGCGKGPIAASKVAGSFDYSNYIAATS